MPHTSRSLTSTIAVLGVTAAGHLVSAGSAQASLPPGCSVSTPEAHFTWAGA